MNGLALIDYEEWGEGEYENQDDGSTIQIETIEPREDTPRAQLRIIRYAEVNRVIEDDDHENEQTALIDYSDDASMVFEETLSFTKFLERLNKKLNEAYEDFLEEDLQYFKGEEKKIKEIQFQKSLDETRKILMTVSESFPLPELVPLGSGGIEFEGFGEKGCRFGIRVKGENKVIYSGLFGSNVSIHGTEKFSDYLYSFLELNLSRLFK